MRRTLALLRVARRYARSTSMTSFENQAITYRAAGSLLVDDVVRGTTHPHLKRKMSSGLVDSLKSMLFVVLVVVGVHLALGMFVMKTDASTTGTIVSLQEGTDSCTSSVAYTVQDIDYALTSYSTQLCELGLGEAVPIDYDTAHPDEAILHADNAMLGTLAMIFWTVTIVIATSTVTTLMIRLRALSYGRRLLRKSEEMMITFSVDAKQVIAAQVEDAQHAMLTEVFPATKHSPYWGDSEVSLRQAWDSLREQRSKRSSH